MCEVEHIRIEQEYRLYLSYEKANYDFWEAWDAAKEAWEAWGMFE